MILPFSNKYPYTSFEQLNLDWIMNTIGSFQSQIDDNRNRITAAEARLDSAEERITAAEGRLDEAESRLDDVEGRLDSAESELYNTKTRVSSLETDMTSLTGRVSANETAISALQSDIGSAQTDLTAITGRVTQAESDIEDLSNDMSGFQNDITALDNRVTTLEGKEVTANPGGTGITLNTLQVGSQVYTIPAGGSGGGGSTVTPNPTGTPIGELTSLGIDSAVFSIPEGTSPDQIAPEFDSTQGYSTGDYISKEGSIYEANTDIPAGTSWDPSDWTEVKVMEELEQLKQAVADIVLEKPSLNKASFSAINETTGSTVIEEIGPGAVMTLTEGIYIVHLTGIFDTTNMGSKRRDLGLYISNSNNDRVAMDKYTVWGTETAQITQAAALECTYYIKVEAGQTLELHPSIRCQVASGSYTYTVDFTFDKVKLA